MEQTAEEYPVTRLEDRKRYAPHKKKTHTQIKNAQTHRRTDTHVKHKHTDADIRPVHSTVQVGLFVPPDWAGT